MAKLNIKIVDIDQEHNTIVVKYSSDSSVKSIDEYDAVAFNLHQYPAATPDQFVEIVKPLLTQYVIYRDAIESNLNTVDLSSWKGYSTSVDQVTLVTAPDDSQQFEAQSNPEVKL